MKPSCNYILTIPKIMSHKSAIIYQSRIVSCQYPTNQPYNSCFPFHTQHSTISFSFNRIQYTWHHMMTNAGLGQMQTRKVVLNSWEGPSSYLLGQNCLNIRLEFNFWALYFGPSRIGFSLGHVLGLRGNWALEIILEPKRSMWEVWLAT